MRKRITRRKGPCRAERGRKREGTAKGARRRRKRAAPGKPEGPDGRPARALPNRREAPTGEEREGKGEGARAPPPPHCKGKGKKGGMQTGKEKTGQRKRKGKTSRESGAEARTKGSGRRKRKSLPNIPKGHVAGREEKREVFYSRITHKPHQYRIHLHRHHPYDKDYNLPAGRISRRGHTPMLDRHIPFSYI